MEKQQQQSSSAEKQQAKTLETFSPMERKRTYIPGISLAIHAVAPIHLPPTLPLFSPRSLLFKRPT